MPAVADVFATTTRTSRTSDDEPGIVRERVRTTFRYRDAAGRVVRDRLTLDRIRVLAIPPAWERVWVCPAADGHLQATGRDARGRKQYRYHPAFRSAKEGEKFGTLAAFGQALPRLRAAVAADLRRPGLPREKVLAAVVELLDRTRLRVGNAEYARANASFGLSTLLDKHVTFAPGELHLRFRGKHGVWHDRTVADARLAKVVRACRDVPGQHLFQYRDADGHAHPVGSADVNAYLRQAAGGDFTAKTFRTWAGTVEAVARLAGLPAPTSATAAARTLAGVVREVAAVLGNTPAVCRKSYMHPRAVEAFVAGEWPAAKPVRGLAADERRVIGLLQAKEKRRDTPRRDRV